MFERLIQFAIEQRIIVLLAVLLMAGVGIASYQKLPIDAVPDITNVQVQINSAAAGFSPLETEQRITFPIETAMAGLPGMQQTRSLSRSGLSQVTVIFKDGTDLFFARQLVNERLQIAKEQLPACHLQALVDQLAGEEQVGAVFENHRHLGQPRTRQRARLLQTRQPGHGGFNRKGNALFGFQR